MFATYEEADELRVPCVICGKQKRTINGHHTQEGVYFTLDKCDVPGCDKHCPGHRSEVVLDSCVDHREMVSFFQ